MTITEEQIRAWVLGGEDEHIEFKTAERQFDADHKLPEYCVALANEGEYLAGLPRGCFILFRTFAFSVKGSKNVMLSEVETSAFVV